MKLKKPKSHVFDGKKYKIKWRKPYRSEGLCKAPNNKTDDRFLMINPRASEQEIMDTLIHEALHACLWVVDEYAVHQTANDISSLLYKVGFRLPE